MPTGRIRAARPHLVRLLPKKVQSLVRETIRQLVRPRIGAPAGNRDVDDVKLEPWKFGARSAVCISSDFELAWASRYVDRQRCLDEAVRTRTCLPLLLRAFDRFEIPVTWAVVGHLMLDSCVRDSRTGLAHPDMPRPPLYANKYWSFDRGDWYDFDPCTSVKSDAEWYASDLVQQIARSATHHEIGCHSFSHTDFSEAHCPPSLATAELNRCQLEAGRFGFQLASFVFPASFEGNFRVLMDCGFIAYRGSAQYDVGYPVKEHGLWNLAGSLQLFDPDVDYRKRVAHYLSVSIESGSLCHFNFHPSLLNPSMVENTLVPMLARLKLEAIAGRIWIGTMGQIAGYCEARSSTAIHVISASETERRLVVEWTLNDKLYREASLTLSLPWSGNEPVCELDHSLVPSPSSRCFVRDGRVYITVVPPQHTVSIRKA